MMRFVVIGVSVLASVVAGYFAQKAIRPLFSGAGNEEAELENFHPARLKKPRRSRIEEPSEDNDRLYQPGGPA